MLVFFFYEFSFNILHLVFIGIKKLKEKDVMMSENESHEEGILDSNN